MNPITIRLMARRKTYKCTICQDTGRFNKYWKRGGEWCAEWAYCSCAKTFKCGWCGGTVFEGFCDTCGSEYIDGKRVPDRFDTQKEKSDV